MCEKNRKWDKEMLYAFLYRCENLKNSKRLIGKEQRILDNLDAIIGLLSNPMLPYERRLRYESFILSDKEIAFAYYTRAYCS